MQNVCKNMKFTHLFGKITHTLTKKIMKTNALLSAKIAAIYVFLWCKIFDPKMWLCKFFDKFQVCASDNIIAMCSLPPHLIYSNEDD